MFDANPWSSLAASPERWRVWLVYMLDNLHWKGNFLVFGEWLRRDILIFLSFVQFSRGQSTVLLLQRAYDSWWLLQHLSLQTDLPKSICKGRSEWIQNGLQWKCRSEGIRHLYSSFEKFIIIPAIGILHPFISDLLKLCSYLVLYSLWAWAIQKLLWKQVYKPINIKSISCFRYHASSRCLAPSVHVSRWTTRMAPSQKWRLGSLELRSGALAASIHPPHLACTLRWVYLLKM